ncbi:MAG: ATP-binding protein [Halanaerobiaceae bacterium]
MRELSLHILDIVQNSISAGADNIEIVINEDIENNLFTIKIIDDGSGIEKEKLKKITDPFVTSRVTREVGLGLSFFQEAARQCDGKMEIDSVVGEGTEVRAYFQYDHIDRAPLGDIRGTLTSLVSLNPDVDFKYKHKYRDREFVFDTGDVKKELEDIKINQPEVMKWIREFLEEGLEDLYGGD